MFTLETRGAVLSTPAQLVLDALFESDWAEDATFLPAAGGAVPVRILRKQPDTATDLAGEPVVTETNLFELRVSEVAAPLAGDGIQAPPATGTVYVIDAEPRRLDPYKLVWTLDMREGP